MSSFMYGLSPPLLSSLRHTRDARGLLLPDGVSGHSVHLGGLALGQHPANHGVHNGRVRQPSHAAHRVLQLVRCTERMVGRQILFRADRDAGPAHPAVTLLVEGRDGHGVAVTAPQLVAEQHQLLKAGRLSVERSLGGHLPHVGRGDADGQGVGEAADVAHGPQPGLPQLPFRRGSHLQHVHQAQQIGHRVHPALLRGLINGKKAEQLLVLEEPGDAATHEGSGDEISAEAA
mmetsp:Transcript_37/g.136  ORF Transcript_37/g.136 Transcript_37/m.136 type:complete len:232 (-) Transcript_37:127-822(-)